MKTNMDCTIILLSYNSIKVTDTCLGRVESAVKFSRKIIGNKVQVIVVDNGSKDGSAEMIKKKHKSVRLIALKNNIGYAAGNNLAMKLSKTPYILLMNSDTYIERDSLVKTFKHMADKNNCDVLVSKWVLGNGVFNYYGGHLPTPMRIIFWAFGFESFPLAKYMFHRIYCYNPGFYKKEGRMEWCPPCFMLLKRKVYDLTKGFDDRLWFHMVDVEWCKRMHDHGLVIRYTPGIQVVHLGGASSKGLEESLVYDNFKGLLHFCKIHYPENLRTISAIIKTGLKIRSTFYFLARKNKLAVMYDSIAKNI